MFAFVADRFQPFNGVVGVAPLVTSCLLADAAVDVVEDCHTNLAEVTLSRRDCGLF